MDKYRKVQKPKEASPPDEIRVTGVGHVCNYVTYTAKLFNEMRHNSVTIRATGKAVSIAVSVAEVVKRRFKGLHQLTSIGCTKLMNEYEPLEEGLDKIEETRTVSFISIQLAREADAEKFDTSAPGYQPPLDDSLVRELDPQVVSRSVRRARGRGGRGRQERDGYGGFGAFGGGRGRGYRGMRRGMGPGMGGGGGVGGVGGVGPQNMTQDGPMMNPSGGGGMQMYDGGFSDYTRGRGARRGRGRGGMDYRGGGFRGGGQFRGGRRGRGGIRRGPPSGMDMGPPPLHDMGPVHGLGPMMPSYPDQAYVQ